MKSIVRKLVAVAAFGAAWVLILAVSSPTRDASEPLAAWRGVTEDARLAERDDGRSRSEASTPRSAPPKRAESLPVTHEGPVDGDDAGRSEAAEDDRPLPSVSARPDRVHDEIEWMEKALATSRRISEAAHVGRPRAAAGSSVEVMRAEAGESARAIGCGDAGARCGSSADCCPSLACVGGVGGFGTVGRCEAPR